MQPLSAALDAENAGATDAAAVRVEEESLPDEPAQAPAFDTKDARQAVRDVFREFVRPMLPKPQRNGSFRGGDAALLDSLMKDRLTFALPMAESMAALIRPEGDWDEACQPRWVGSVSNGRGSVAN